MPATKLKKDKYRKSRGGYSRLLRISCAQCKTFLVLYQKDGPGSLKRMYLDRIVEPERKRSGKALICGKCKQIIGTLHVYKKEKRPAFRLYQDSISKRIVKAR